MSECEKYIDRLYVPDGYVLGVNYICTFEDNENPLDVRVVDKIIEKILS